MKFRVIVSNSIFALNVLLLFLLIFRRELEVPVWLQVVGRLHPLLVHLPIGFLILAILAVVFKANFKRKSFHNFLNFVLYLGALSAALAANLGLLLSAEGGHDETQITRHLIAGVGVSLLSWCVLLIGLYAPKKIYAFNLLLSFTAIALVAAGHYGSVLTYGANYIWQPLAKETTETLVITDSTSLFEAAIHPLLHRKCMSCHNDRKAKGGLIMTATETLANGGKHGPVWIPGDPANSTLLKRIHLPEEEDDHMPPAGKPQLTRTEKRLLYYWILDRADVSKPWTKFSSKDSLHILATEFINQEQKQIQVHYSFPFAPPETVQALNSPYCSVSQIALDEPAIKADYFLAVGFDSKKLAELLRIKEQLVFLNLTGMPLTDPDANVVRQFINLEKLNLGKTTVGETFLRSIRGLKNIKSLSLVSTPTDRKSLEAIGSLPSLKEVFLWNTKVNATDITSLRKQFPLINWDTGYESKEILTLTPPLLANESFLLNDQEGIHLKHNLPGTQIRYTLDSREPDSLLSSEYSAPVLIAGYTIMKARAFKKGWYSSSVVPFYFFKKGVKPLTGILSSAPNKDYKGEGIATLTDNIKGSADNFREITWLGYREQPLIGLFHMAPNANIHTITISYGRNPSSYILPPASVEVWGGSDSTHLRLVQRTAPQQPDQKEKASGRVEGIVLRVSPLPIFKVIVQPVARVPVWISKKPEKGWVMVDEIIFNQN